MVERLTYRRKVHYATKSNHQRIVKTPGGRNVFQIATKKARRPHCSEPSCQAPLPGIPAVRPYQLKFLKKRERTVSRPYGGNLCHKCVRQRIIRAFLLEEQREVKKAVHMQQKKKKKEGSSSKTESKKAKKK
eukprot:TRINITY_DN191354_c0_g1_i1.p1 TRINITY_DN191354_c0_g1~~TRINITY_DN191354_c0_g1_i1.p1  ORF type:complete len:132 (-),score=24.18 TRINITY_DN191354_c0_g1_i1:111-506(-)